MIINSLRDVNAKVRFAAKILNETLRDVVLIYPTSKKISLEDIAITFAENFQVISSTPYQNLIIEWLDLIDEFDFFSINDIFPEIFEGFIKLVDMDSEETIEWFYSKVEDFIKNFMKPDKMSSKHFINCMKIQSIILKKYLTSEIQPESRNYTNMGKLYMLETLNDVQDVIEQYLIKRKFYFTAQNENKDLEAKVEGQNTFQVDRFSSESDEEKEEMRHNDKITLIESKEKIRLKALNLDINNIINSEFENPNDFDELNHSFCDNKINPLEKDEYTNELQYETIHLKLKEHIRITLTNNLSNFFHLLTKIYGDDCQEIQNGYDVMYSQYKSLIKHIDLGILIDILDKFVKKNDFLNNQGQFIWDNKEIVQNLNPTSGEIFGENQYIDKKVLPILNCQYALLKTIQEFYLNLEKKDKNPDMVVNFELIKRYGYDDTKKDSTIFSKSRLRFNQFNSTVALNQLDYKQCPILNLSFDGNDVNKSSTDYSESDKEKRKMKRRISMQNIDTSAFQYSEQKDLKEQKLESQLKQIKKWLLPGLSSSSKEMPNKVKKILNKLKEIWQLTLKYKKIM